MFGVAKFQDIVLIIDIDTNKLILQIDIINYGKILNIMAHPKENLLFIFLYDESILMFDIKNGKLFNKLNILYDNGYSIKFGTNDDIFTTVGKKIIRWNIWSGKCLATFFSNHSPYSFRFFVDINKNILHVSGQTSSTIESFDINTGKIISTSLGYLLCNLENSTAIGIKFDTNTFTNNPTFVLLDSSDMSFVREIPVNSKFGDFSISSLKSNKMITINNHLGPNHLVNIWDIRSMTCQDAISLLFPVVKAEVSKNGDKLFIYGMYGELSVMQISPHLDGFQDSKL